MLRGTIQRAPIAVAFRTSCLLAALSLAGCGMFAESWEWNQKLTVEVMTPDGIRSGSAVSYVRWQEPDPFGNYGTRYRGEATVVDLGQGRFLFALIGEPTKYIALRTFNHSITERGFAAMARIRGSRDVPREHYPLLMTFTDIGDPTSLRALDPDNLAATFGPGVALTQVRLEITDETMTEGKVERLLAWLDWPKVDPALNGGRWETLRYPNSSPRGYGTISTIQLLWR